MIWFVGRSFEEYRRYFDEIGEKYGVFQDKHRAKIPSDENLPCIEVDFTSEETITNSLPKHVPGLEGVLATYEAYVYGQAIIANHFGLPGLSKEAAYACTDK